MDVRRKLELKLPPPLKSVAAQVDEDGLYIVPGTPYRLMRNFNMRNTNPYTVPTRLNVASCPVMTVRFKPVNRHEWLMNMHNKCYMVDLFYAEKN